MNPYLLIGISIIAGISFALIVSNIKLPSVAGYIISGIIMGQILSLFPDLNVMKELSVFSTLALGLIAFTVGGELKLYHIKELGKSIIYIVIFESLTAFILVTGGIYLLSKDISLSLILGAISSATAPAATVMVIEQYRTRGPLTTTLLAVVGLDDGMALILYSFAISIVKVMLSPHSHPDVTITVFHPLLEIVFSLIVGGIFGFLLGGYIRIRYTSRIENLSLPLGAVLIISGLAKHFHFSGLLANMAFGFILTNYASHRSGRIFKSIRDFAPPIYIIFFVLAGTTLDIKLLPHIGILGLAYLILRIAGKISGASFGAYLSNAPSQVKKYIGFGLISQVGIAIGLAVVIYNELSVFGAKGMEMAKITINVLLATTIFTEIIGPALVKYAMKKADEIGKRN